MLVTRVPPSGAAGDGREQLARFLRDRRGRLDPDDCGFARGRRRRTPGLRREEVAHLAGVSVTWYTWLEQAGRPRKAVPSTDVLDGIARALRLDRSERDHLYLMAHGRLPPRATATAGGVPASLQYLVDSLVHPAIVRTADTWDVVAHNRAALAVFGGAEPKPRAERNSLRRVFTDPAVRASMPDWERDARRFLAGFRGSRARAGPSVAADRLIADLSRASPEFARWWTDDHDVAPDAQGTKRVRHPTVGPMTFHYSTLTPDAAEGLTVLLFVPATAADRSAVEDLMAAVD